MKILLENWKKFLLNETNLKRKAIYVVGGAGSGKSTVVKNLHLPKDDFVVINSDDEFERLLDKHAISKNIKDMTPDERSKQASLSATARKTTQSKKEKHITDYDAMIIDSVGGDLKRIQNEKKDLEQLGYDVFMIFVDTDLETAKKRNIFRGEQGGRRLSDKAVEKSWNSSHRNFEAFQRMFGNLFYSIDTTSEEFEEMIKELREGIFRFIRGD